MTVTSLPRSPRSLLLDLTVPGEPITWKRPERDRRGRSYTNTVVEAQQQLIGLLARQTCREPTPAPVIVEADFWLGSRRRADIDNLFKLVADSLNTIAYVDDSQIIEAYLHKHYDKGFPRTEVLVWEVVEQ